VRSSIVEQVKPAYEVSVAMRIRIVVVYMRRRLGLLVKLSTVKSCDLAEISTPCRLTRRAALKGIRVFLTRAGARGLGITTRKAGRWGPR